MCLQVCQLTEAPTSPSAEGAPLPAVGTGAVVLLSVPVLSSCCRYRCCRPAVGTGAVVLLHPRPLACVSIGQEPGAHARLFSRQRTLPVRVITDVNVGSDLRILLRRH